MRPSCMDAATFCQLHLCGVMLLTLCGSFVPSELQLLLAEQAIGSAAEAAEPVSSGSLLQSAAWQLIALAPKLAAVIQASVADLKAAAASSPLGHSAWLSKLDQTCVNVSTILLTALTVLKEQPASWEQLASWVAAAIAGLQLHPRLLQLGAASQQAGARPGGGAEKLAWQVLVRLCQPPPHGGISLPAAPAAACALDCLAVQLWELHSTAARLCHFLASRDSPTVAGWQAHSPSECWTQLLLGLAGTAETAQLAMRARLDMLVKTEAGGAAMWVGGGTTLEDALHSAALKCNRDHASCTQRCHCLRSCRQAVLESQALSAAHAPAVMAVANAGDAAPAAHANWPLAKAIAMLSAAV